jgi:NADPH2:quinone reductase
MRVIEFSQYGPASVLQQADRPLPEPSSGQLRIKVHAVGVNPADTKWRSGMMQSFSPKTLPLVVGYDIAGVVDAIGPDVTGFAQGDRVFTALTMTMGGYAEYVLSDASWLARIPAELDFAAAATLPTPGLTGFQLIEEHVRPASGSLVLVTGATGAVGRLATFAAKRLGATVVAAVRASQRDEALAAGADHTIVLGEDDWSGVPFDHVADTVGGNAAAKLCTHLAPNGTIHTVAMPPLSGEELPVPAQFVAVHPDPAKLEEIGGLLAKVAFSLPIVRQLPLAEAAEAHSLVEAGGAGGKVVLLV